MNWLKKLFCKHLRRTATGYYWKKGIMQERYKYAMKTECNSCGKILKVNFILPSERAEWVGEEII